VDRTVFLSAVLFVLLVFPAGAAAFGSGESADQDLDAEVVPDHLLGIEVTDVSFGPVRRGESSEQRFGLRVLDTTSGGWSVTVAGADLTATGDACPVGVEGWCVGPEGEPATIPNANLFLQGGSLADVVIGGSGTLAEQPLELVRGVAAAGSPDWIDLDHDQPRIRLTVPEDAPYGHYRTTLTYTITSTVDPAP
jgi:hypothetical protein